jgi:hypothetical protein
MFNDPPLGTSFVQPEQRKQFRRRVAALVIAAVAVASLLVWAALASMGGPRPEPVGEGDALLNPLRRA